MSTPEFVTFNVTLACKIGMAQSLILQRIIDWTKYNKQNDRNFHDGKWWSYNSYKAWSEQLPFCAERSIRRYITDLVEAGLLFTSHFGDDPLNRTNWYSPNLEAIDKLLDSPGQTGHIESAKLSKREDIEQVESPCGQIGHIKVAKLDTCPINQIQTSQIQSGNISPAKAVERVKAKKALVVDDDAGKGSEVWESYKQAFFERYQKEPLRNMRANIACKELYKRLGKDAKDVVAFYVTHNDSFFVRNRHTLNILVSNAERLHTDWQMGVQSTNAESTMKDRSQARDEQADRVRARLREQGFNY